ncbi:hypothetical protein [Tenggerimyces flavus]|uniref:DUF3558 domain-containing protein n=1 Tax=Tenggerimyces flavus TaxID=1708749 RepID=A0ABV7YDH0_9ACTN|nr:hypothetical protein [Tenggerimyces flavus]MBM7785991.1 hypothetical protein [Tenggerimyces flavus]
MTNGAALLGRVCRGLVALALAGVVVAGCSADPIAPPELEPDSESTVSGGVAPGATASSEPPTGSAAPGEAIDVCALVPTDVVRALIGAASVEQVPEASPSATPAPGGPTMPTAYRCTYKWGEDPVATRLLLSVLPSSGADTPQAAVDNLLGTPSTAVRDVGEAAGVDRSGRLGNGYAFLAAAKQTTSGVGAVLVRAPTATTDDKLATLAKHLLAAL